MQALAATDLAEVVAVAEPDPASRTGAVERVPGARGVSDLGELLEMDLDGVVIATPSALHAEQARQAFAGGVAVFCQKPLGRDLAETRSVIDAARAADRLLGVDLSYRHLEAVEAVRALLRDGELGRVYAAELTFHNAYGPDKPWFTRRSQSGGGCLIDLGTHLLDLVMQLTGASDAEVLSRVLLRGGEPLVAGTEAVEDFALAQLRLNSGIDVRLACSWFLPAGRDCVIEMTLYGTAGAASLRNVSGSFYDFRGEHWQGTSSAVIAQPPDDWGARALILWTAQLAQTPSFDPAAEEYASVAGVLDTIYRTAA
jgi:predicted dehydrogenase